LTSQSGDRDEAVPRITIVTPCLNAISTIERTVASIASQGYPNLEHVVVDGESTDGTLEMLRSFEAHGVIRLVTEPDSGLAEALNKGFALATGEIIGSLNADDLYLRGTIDRVADAFRAHPEASWLTGRCIIIDADDKEIRRPITTYKDFLLRHYSYRALLTQCFVSAPATFVARRAFGEVGPFDQGLTYAVDYDLFLRLGRLMPPVILRGQPLAAYRMAGDTLSLTGFERQFAEGRALARRHGGDDRLAIEANGAMATGIVLTYRVLRALRARRISLGSGTRWRRS
jgi:glycosyltransferase involved in cell wall biosynthesis